MLGLEIGPEGAGSELTGQAGGLEVDGCTHWKSVGNKAGGEEGIMACATHLLCVGPCAKALY